MGTGLLRADRSRRDQLLDLRVVDRHLDERVLDEIPHPTGVAGRPRPYRDHQPRATAVRGPSRSVSRSTTPSRVVGTPLPGLAAESETNQVPPSSRAMAMLTSGAWAVVDRIATAASPVPALHRSRNR